ncbi:Spy/CpxP family protein refolding chaperone [Fulvivirga lutimaris]|uniref:Spy/CpxP family protein refolding chaperone n=1 Tax=Fulvivirga lutimaris TaxID=1819566 RepID=UPI0012BC893C|nr:periplasmic heavy metal sensor [Fulvivirga lutimaris]MTI40069.1 periplasmic heavy metal sensor [Fulvivirga lutimaris]
MKKSIFRSALLAIMIAGASVVANGQHHKRAHDSDYSSRKEFRKMDKDGHRGLPDMTEEQKEKIKGLKISHLKVITSVENELQEKKARLNTLSSAEKVDKKTIEKTVKEIGELKTKLMLAREFHKQDVRAILTEEQRVVFDRMGNHKKGKRHGR